MVRGVGGGGLGVGGELQNCMGRGRSRFTPAKVGGGVGEGGGTTRVGLVLTQEQGGLAHLPIGNGRPLCTAGAFPILSLTTKVHKV